MSAPLVRHEDGRLGVFVTEEVRSGWCRRLGTHTPETITRSVYRGGLCLFNESHLYREGSRLHPEWAAYLRANEFDINRDFELIRLPDGYGCFYL